MKPKRRTDFEKPLTPVERILMFLVYWLGTFCYRLLCATYRVRHVGEANRRFVFEHGNIVGMLWHQRLFCAPFALKDVPELALLVSQSKDGEMIRYVLEGLGYKTIQGSSSRRGSAAFREMARHVKRGGRMGITPDGPRGPARKVHKGGPRLALEAGSTVVPISISASRCWFAPSWDRFMFPKPLSRIVVAWGDPIPVEARDPDADSSPLAARIETALERTTREADLETRLEAPRGGRP